MKKKTTILVILSVLCLVAVLSVFVGCSKVGSNMFTSNEEGTFKYTKISELKNNWILKSSDSITDISTVFSLNNDDDNTKIEINTSTPGWAYIGQKVKLNAGCYYRISYDFNVKSISTFKTGEGYKGAFVTILEDDDFNKTVDGIQYRDVGAKKETITFKSGETGDATILFCVGDKDYPVTADVILNSFTITRIAKADATENRQGIFRSDYYGEVKDFNAFYIVMGALIVIVVGYAGYFMLQRHIYFSETPDGKTDFALAYKGGFLAKLTDSKTLGITLIVTVGLAVTLITDVLSTAIGSSFAHTTMGYNLEGLSAQALFIAKYGPQNLSKSLALFCSDNGYTLASIGSMPLQLYFLGFVGLFGRIFESVGGEYFATMFFLRFFVSLANIVTALVLYKIFTKSVGRVGATIAGSMYLLIPTVFAGSAVWGYTDAVTALMLVSVIYFMLNKNYIGAASVYAVSCLFSLTALFFAPIIVFYTILVCMNDIKTLIPMSIILVSTFVLFYALTVPFNLNAIKDGTTMICFTNAWNELYTNSLYTLNAFNFQALLGNNFGKISTASLVVSIVFILFMLTLVAVAYFKGRNRLNLVLLASAFIAMMFIFSNNMNPMSMYVALAMMLIYAIMTKEKRIYFSFVMFAVLIFVNVSYVELFAGYTLTAVNQVSTNAMVYVFGILWLLAVLYYIYIVYDIVVSRKVRKIKGMSLNYGDSVVNFFRKIQKAYYKMLIKTQKKNS